MLLMVPRAVTLSYIGANASTANTSTYTFTAEPIGAAQSDRDVVVFYTVGDTGTVGTVSSVTIGGNSATLDVNSANDRIIIGFARLRVTTGTTADIVVNCSGGTPQNCNIAVYRLIGHPTGTPLSAVVGYVTTGATVATPSMNISNSGAAVVGASTWVSSGSAGTYTYPANLTKDLDSGAVETVFSRACGHGAFASGLIGTTFTITESLSLPVGSRYGAAGLSW